MDLAIGGAANAPTSMKMMKTPLTTATLSRLKRIQTDSQYPRDLIASGLVGASPAGATAACSAGRMPSLVTAAPSRGNVMARTWPLPTVDVERQRDVGAEDVL